MITKVNDMDLRVLSLFTKGYDKHYHIREVEKLLFISSRTALVTLAKLEQKGILESEIKGRNKSYSIKNSLLSREYFFLTEQYKKIVFLEKNPLIKEIVEKIESASDSIVIIFGSYAKNLQKDDSDLDLFILGTYNHKIINTVSKTYGVDINVKNYPQKMFNNELKQDILFKEILEHHILISGVENFLKGVLTWTR